MYSIILPTYNEAENIKTAIKMINHYLTTTEQPFEIIVVDDNSPDGTSDIVESMLEKYPVQLVRRKKKEGLGSAYGAGIENCKYDYVVIMDADMSHDPLHILDFIKKQSETDCDIVFGTRYEKGGGVSGWNTKRKIMSRGANNLAKVILNVNISDMTGSFRLYRRSVLIGLLGMVDSSGYSVQMELAFYASKNRFRIEECPIVFYDRVKGISKCSFFEIILFVKTLLLLFCKN